ncbi:MAG: radical SAM protein [Candidatus Parcubacteria bacterium]|nr:radical SAM protein [Candidatus Parcubacteria bacterium]
MNEKNFTNPDRIVESESQALTPDKFLALDADKILELVSSGKKSVTAIVQDLREIGYQAALKYLKNESKVNTPAEKKDQREVLKSIQQKIDQIILSWLEENLKEMDLAAKVREDIAERKRGLSVLKVIRGLRCNYNCRFCLEQTSDEEQKKYIEEYANLSYSLERLRFAMLYARMAFGLDEINFSGGDPLVNKPAQLAEEIKMAKEIGFSHITILTNGSLLTKELIDSFVDAGLTNLTVSLHTADKKNFNYLVRPKSGKDYYDHTVEMVKYAATKPNLIVRINTAKTKDFTESAEDLIAWAKNLGVQQITINEMIRANEFSEEQYEPLGQTLNGYVKTYEIDWGLTLYAPEKGEGPSVAICRFGDKNFATEQKKDLYVLPNGTLSQYLFETKGGIEY